MPHFICLACKTRLHSTERGAEPIGDLCPVCGLVLELDGDLGEIVGYRVVETRGGTWDSGASGAARRLADRVGEIIARREPGHARVRLEIESCDADSVSPQVQAGSARASGAGDDAITTTMRSHHSRAAASAARPPGCRRRASSARTAPPDESSRFALGLGSVDAR